jgi:hypothetical protein
VGNDAASSAQSKCAVNVVKLGGIKLVGGETRDGGRETTARGGSYMSTAVKDGGNGGTARLGPSWAELGWMGSERGCSESGSVFRCSRDVVRGPEWGGAGGTAIIDGHVDGDVAMVWRGSRWGTGVWGSGRGELGGLGRVLDRRWRWGGWLSGFVNCATRSDERVCTSSRSSVFWAIDSLDVLFTAL